VVVAAAPLLAFYHNVTSVHFESKYFCLKKCHCLTIMIYTRILRHVGD
jgi:hypothetical protein